jgi:hypothetical protein
MPRLIQLAAELPASPDPLFDLFLDREQHAAFTAAAVESGRWPTEWY